VRYGGWPTRDTAQFNTLAATQVSPPAPKEPRKLVRPVTGDASNGEKLVADRTRGGSCLACHVMGRAGDADLPGNVGPDLSEIGNGGRDDEWLWNYVYDARAYNPATVMPPWGTHRLFDDKEIGDIVAFLKTLKSPARFKTEVDDPAKRHAPVETRDNLDPTTNPAMWAVDKGEELYKRREASGFSCATCHGDAGPHFKSWAAAMPKWEPRFDKVIGIEEFVFRHAKATTGATWLMQSDENVAMAVYLRNVANGQEMTVDVASPGAKEAFERGRALAEVKIGALNFSCRDCHDPARGGLKWIRGQWLAEQKGQLDHFPTWRTSLNQIWDIRKRFQWCGVAIWANELPPDARQYGDLELYLASVNAGQKLNVPGIRH
jgi:sulfur-oxidizing protein SoxA